LERKTQKEMRKILGKEEEFEVKPREIESIQKPPEPIFKPIHTEPIRPSPITNNVPTSSSKSPDTIASPTRNTVDPLSIPDPLNVTISTAQTSSSLSSVLPIFLQIIIPIGMTII
jgi:hypothetical protein